MQKGKALRLKVLTNRIINYILIYNVSTYNKNDILWSKNVNADIQKDTEMIRNFDANGVSCVELLPGVVDFPFKAYKYNLKKGSRVSPQQYRDKAVAFIFGKGNGYIADLKGGFVIDRLCFYAPDFDHSKYSIHAVSDLEFVMCVSDMNDYDRERASVSRVHLPFFRTIDQCYRYEQYCKTEGTESRSILFGDCGRLGKITMGYSYSKDIAGSAGTIENGHREVHQFNYALGEDCDFLMIVEGESGRVFRHTEGDWSFVRAGLAHNLVSSPGKAVRYVWVEIYTSERGVY